MIQVSLELIFLLNVRLLTIYRKMLEFYVTFDELKEKLDEEAPKKYAKRTWFSDQT